MKKLKALVLTFLYAGTADMDRNNPTRGVSIGVNLVCLCIIGINLVFGTAFFLTTLRWSILVGSYVEAVLVGFVIHLNFRKKYAGANLIFYSILNGATFYFALLLGQGADVELMIVFLIAVALLIFEKTSLSLFCIVTTVLLFVLLEVIYKTNYVPPIEAQGPMKDLIRWVASGVVIFLVILIFFLYTRSKAFMHRLYAYSKQVEAAHQKEMVVSHAKSQFIKHSCHDALAAFSGIKINANELFGGIVEKNVDQETRRMAEDLVAGCAVYVEMLKNILDYTKFEAGQKNSIHLEEIEIRELLAVLSSYNQYIANRKNVRLKMEISNDVPLYIITDKTKLTQIFINLLTNAIKFSRPAGTVLIEFTLQNSYWSLSVTDEGEGISAENLERIFEPFVTFIDPQFNPDGIGLGLAITKHLVQLMGGEITVQSKLKVGSQFTIALPIYSAPSDPDDV